MKIRRSAPFSESVPVPAVPAIYYGWSPELSRPAVKNPQVSLSKKSVCLFIFLLALLALQ